MEKAYYLEKSEVNKLVEVLLGTYGNPKIGLSKAIKWIKTCLRFIGISLIISFLGSKVGAVEQSSRGSNGIRVGDLCKKWLCCKSEKNKILDCGAGGSTIYPVKVRLGWTVLTLLEDSVLEPTQWTILSIRRLMDILSLSYFILKGVSLRKALRECLFFQCQWLCLPLRTACVNQKLVLLSLSKPCVSILVFRSFKILDF